MKEQVHSITDEALAAIAKAGSLAELNQIRVNVLGKKGTLTGVLRSLGSLAPEERPIMGELVNKARTQLEAALEDKGRQLAEEEQQRKLAAERLDVELPGRRPRRGHIHPLRAVAEEICEVFLGMGFSIAEGPEVELDYYNFEALNLPPEHPAREMQDSLYINEKVLLRTHTSPVQVRTMEAQYPKPIRIIAPGRVYRRDALDATHSPMFHQIEGLVVDENISFGDLKGVLTIFAQKIFGEDRKVRFRPSYFPFTEPSAEVDVSCGCGGKGCRICKRTGWLEILGAGSVNPKVLAMSKYDPAKYTGFAFGMGIERIAILKYGITDIRLFYENDIRFLRQF